MTNIQRGTLFLTISLCFGSAQGYELATHSRLTEQAFLRSNLVQDQQLLGNLGLSKLPSLNPFGDIYFDVSGSQAPMRSVNDFEKALMSDPNQYRSIKGWLMRGAIREDDVPQGYGSNPQDDPNGQIIRVLNHFYDPANNSPLTVGGRNLWLTKPAPTWAMGSTDAFSSPNTADTSRRNHFTVFDAREAMYRALTGMDAQGITTGSSETIRKYYWATTFRALGDVLHLNQDMAQPQHRRNAHDAVLAGFTGTYLG